MGMRERILKHISDHPHDANAYVDLVDYYVSEKDHEHNLADRGIIGQAMGNTVTSEEFLKINHAYKKSLLLSAKVDLDSYLQYLEYERDPEKKFYMPRRKVLYPVVQDLQAMDDDKLDFYGLSLPPRVGKSTLCIMYMTRRMGMYPDDANLMSGHSDKLTNGFYEEILNIITDNVTYSWADVFPGIQIIDKSAKDESIDLCTKKRFPTLTCRSIGGTLTGAVEIGKHGILYVDDLVEDLEESLNLLRLQAKYDAYLNQLKDRKKEGSKELMVGTRWNVYDPLGRVQEQYADNPRYKFKVIPALNGDNESNFVYSHNLGFSTKYYIDMKESIDDATWCAKYMGNPYVREGLLFHPDELNYYNGVLPDGEPTKVAVCDVAWGGGDSLSMPFLYIYGDSVYVHDVIFNAGDKTVTYPVVEGRMKQHLPHKTRFEGNNGGSEYADEVDRRLRESGIRLNIFSKKAPNNTSKLARIIQFAPDIKKWYFRSPMCRDREYEAFMRELCTFVQTGKNPHDDAPDSLAQAADELYRGEAQVEIMDRFM